MTPPIDERVLATLATEVEVARLFTRFNWAMDVGEPDEWAACFAADGEFVMEGAQRVAVSGRPQLAAFCARARELYRFRHLSSNVTIEARGDDELDVASYMTVFDLDAGAAILVMGIMRDRIVRRDGEWVFTRRVMQPDTAVEVPAEVL